MRAVRYLVIAMLIAAISSFGFGSHASAMRAPAVHTLGSVGTNTVTPDALGDPYYDIVSLGFYCADGTTACYDNCSTSSVSCPGLDFAGVEAVGNDPYANYGVPGELVMQCDQTNSSGDVIEGYLDTYNWGPNAQYTGSDGVIGGKATLLSANTYETDNATSATSSISASAYSGSFGTVGTVTGVQNTDNSTHTLMSGGFRITIHGVLENVTTDHYYVGTISCFAGGPATMVLQSDIACPSGDINYAPFAAEGVLEPYAGDEYHNYSDLGPTADIGIGLEEYPSYYLYEDCYVD